MLIYLLYRIAGLLAFPLLILYLGWRVIRDRNYARGVRERFGFPADSFRQTAPGSIWLHAVSVGEIVSSIELIRRLRAEMPETRIFVSSTTLTGRAMAEQKLADLAAGIFYVPLDYAFAVRRVLRLLRPSAVVVLETEIWPNLYREAKRFGCGLVVVNARLSDRRYGRYQALRWFFHPVLQFPDRILAQNELAASRYRELGASPERVVVTGNLKYDFRIPAEAPAAVREFVEETAAGPVWIAASTMPPREAGDVDEDDAVIQTFRGLAAQNPRMLLILVPRRPERFDLAASKLEAAGIPFMRRSELKSGDKVALPGVLLLDSMGELATLFAMADAVFMGGTLCDRGGHNILEPAFVAKPIVLGPHMENFPDIIEEFRAGAAVREISRPRELGPALQALFDDPEARRALGERAQRLAAAKSGTTARAVAEIVEQASRAVPQLPARWWRYLLLWFPARLWEAGVRWKRARKLAARTSLRAPVVSVGGLAMGGTGKTPLVLWLSKQLRAAGHAPAILTRGYRRRSPEPSTVLAAGEPCAIDRTGDEAQLFLRGGAAALGIGADRIATGHLVEDRFHPTVILLDDGFQHWQLNRKVDLVLLDTLDPFGGGDVFPMGRLREPVDQLARAHAVVLTRTEKGRQLPGVEEVIRRYNPSAPIFYSRVVPLEWKDPVSGQSWPARELPFKKIGAFCGLGNHASFWRTLDQLGIAVQWRWEFDDHVVYRPAQLRRLSAQAQESEVEVLLTTEKDWMNLGANGAQALRPVQLLFLKITVEVDEGAKLLELLPRAPKVKA